MSTPILTYSAINAFRNCPCKYRLRYVDGLTPLDKPHALAFGSVVHTALELWYRSVGSPTRLVDVLDFIDDAYEQRQFDDKARADWHVARSMLIAYSKVYADEELTVVEVEKEFETELFDPRTQQVSSEYRIAGKVDGIVRCHGELYLLEHKTAAVVDGNYLDKLWTDTQIALYGYYLRRLGYPIVGVIYNVLLKSRLKQAMGETQAEYEQRLGELAAKNKSGKSSAKRQMPESDHDFQDRLAAWYARPEAFHRELIYLSEDRMRMLEQEVSQIAKQCSQATREDSFYMNTSYCFHYGRACEYLPYCQSGFSPHVADNLYEITPPHEELGPSGVGSLESGGAVF